MPLQSVTNCSKALAEKGLKIAFAESATAGRLCTEFSLCPLAGEILMGGIVSYDVSVKKMLLQVPIEIIDKYTPESAEVTRLMAMSLERFMKADIYVGITGLTRAGGSENEGKPVGTIFIHLLFNGRSLALHKVFKGDEASIIVQTVNYMADFIHENCT